MIFFPDNSPTTKSTIESAFGAYKSIILGFFSLLLTSTILSAQNPTSPTHTDSLKKKTDVMEQLLDNSRPGAHHAELEKLAGEWSFQDARLSFVKGTLTRKPIYNGRFFLVEMTGGKLKVPVADGQMKEEFYQSMQIEGYDNPKMQFTAVSINNHIGSDIQLQTGTYDSAAREFSYTWEDELLKGSIEKNKRVLKMTDDKHYTETFYSITDGKEKKVRQLDYTKINH